MRHYFETQQWLPYPPERVFNFFANPENLPRIMPAWQKTRIEGAKLTTPSREQNKDMPHLPHAVAGEGSELYVTFRPVPFLPFRIGWRVLISEFVYLSHFCDTQLAGPFKYWHHCHRVQPQERGGIAGTLVRDELEYELPLPRLSHWTDGIARVNLAGVFRYRQREVETLLK